MSDAALGRARVRTRDLDGVEIRSGALPSDWPEGTADLVVFAEIGYYLAAADLALAVRAAIAHLEPGGSLLAVHWRHDAPDYPLRGDDVHDVIDRQPGLVRFARYRDADFVLDVWSRGPSDSVAAATGVLRVDA